MSISYFVCSPVIILTIVGLLFIRLPYKTVDLPTKICSSVGWIVAITGLTIATVDLTSQHGTQFQAFSGFLRSCMVASMVFNWGVCVPMTALQGQVQVLTKHRVLSAVVDTVMYYSLFVLAGAIPLSILAAQARLDLESFIGVIFSLFNILGLIYLTIPFMYSIVNVPIKLFLAGFPEARYRSALRTAFITRSKLSKAITELHEYETRLTAALSQVTDPVAHEAGVALAAQRPTDLGAPASPGRRGLCRKRVDVDLPVELVECTFTRPFGALDSSEEDIFPSLAPTPLGTQITQDADTTTASWHWRQLVYGTSFDCLLTEFQSVLERASDLDCQYRRALRRAGRARAGAETLAAGGGIKAAVKHKLWQMLCSGAASAAGSFSILMLVSQWMFGFNVQALSPLGLYANAIKNTGDAEAWLQLPVILLCLYYILFGLSGSGPAPLLIYTPAPPRATQSRDLLTHAGHLCDVCMPMVWLVLGMSNRLNQSKIGAIMKIDDSLPFLNMSTSRVFAYLMSGVAIYYTVMCFVNQRRVKIDTRVENIIRDDLQRYLGHELDLLNDL